jgi:site-specific recombinase XerD
MAATIPSTALVPVQPVFAESERLALAGFLAGYRGLTREAYTLDLRQFTSWCRARSLPLFSVRRADIETFAREMEAKGPGPRHGHPAAVHHRRVLQVRRRRRAP